MLTGVSDHVERKDMMGLTSRAPQSNDPEYPKLEAGSQGGSPLGPQLPESIFSTSLLNLSRQPKTIRHLGKPTNMKVWNRSLGISKKKQRVLFESRKHALPREESALENEKFYRAIYFFTFCKSSEDYKLT